MKKINLFVSFLVASLLLQLQAQVGINTSTPDGVFHIDGKGDNSNTLTANQLQNDVIVSDLGHVGIGARPSNTSRMHIKTGGTIATPITGFRLQDGNEGIGNLLISDADGNGTWVEFKSEKFDGNIPNVQNILQYYSTLTDLDAYSSYTNTKIELPVGQKYLLNITAYIIPATIDPFNPTSLTDYMYFNENVGLRRDANIFLSTSPTQPVMDQRYYGGHIKALFLTKLYNGVEFDFYGSGVIPIDLTNPDPSHVTNGNISIYLWCRTTDTCYRTSTQTAVNYSNIFRILSSNNQEGAYGSYCTYYTIPYLDN